MVREREGQQSCFSLVGRTCLYPSAMLAFFPRKLLMPFSVVKENYSFLQKWTRETQERGTASEESIQ